MSKDKRNRVMFLLSNNKLRWKIGEAELGQVLADPRLSNDSVDCEVVIDEYLKKWWHGALGDMMGFK